MADFIKSRVNVKLRSNQEICFTVESFHSCNNPNICGRSFHSLKRDDYDDALETASKVVANATGGLVKKGFSKRLDNIGKLSLYADCIEEASHLFDEMGHEALGNNLREFSEELKSALRVDDKSLGNISLKSLVVFEETGVNSMLPFSYLSDRSYGKTVGKVRNTLRSMFENISTCEVIEGKSLPANTLKIIDDSSKTNDFGF